MTNWTTEIGGSNHTCTRVRCTNDTLGILGKYPYFPVFHSHSGSYEQCQHTDVNKIKSTVAAFDIKLSLKETLRIYLSTADGMVRNREIW